jgi:hypothetical protein
MRREIGSTIAVACAAAALALPGVALPRSLAALLAGRTAPASGPSPSVTASSPGAASLQTRLTALLDGTGGRRALGAAGRWGARLPVRAHAGPA